MIAPVSNEAPQRSISENVVNIHKKQKLEMEITAAMLLLLFLVVHVLFVKLELLAKVNVWHINKWNNHFMSSGKNQHLNIKL